MIKQRLKTILYKIMNYKMHLCQQKNYLLMTIYQQEAFEKCWAHSPLRAATLLFTRCRYCRTPPAHRCPQQQRQQRQRVSRDRGDRYGPIEWAQ